MIPCGHTYCTKCLSELCAGSDTIICPQCRKQHDVPTAGIAQFPRNLSYQQLLDIRTEQLVSTRQCQVSSAPPSSAVEKEDKIDECSFLSLLYLSQSLKVCSHVVMNCDLFRFIKASLFESSRSVIENVPSPIVSIVTKLSVWIVRNSIAKSFPKRRRLYWSIWLDQPISAMVNSLLSFRSGWQQLILDALNMEVRAFLTNCDAVKKQVAGHAKHLIEAIKQQAKQVGYDLDEMTNEQLE